MRAHLRLVAPTAAEPSSIAAADAERDEELVVRMRGGDAGAASATWRRYSVLVRGMIVRTIGPCAEVEDVVQDVFAALFRRVASIRDPSALRSFVIGITLREIRVELRRRRVRRWLRLTESGDLPEPTTNQHATDRETFARLHRALDMLDVRSRMAFVLRHVEGFELTEISDALECSLATTKRILSHADERFASIAERDPILAPFVAKTEEDT